MLRLGRENREMMTEIKKLACLLLLLVTLVAADDKTVERSADTNTVKMPVQNADDASDPVADKESKTKSGEQPDEDPNKGLVKLSPKEKIWVHPGKKWIVVDGRVCLREGQLEMFAVPYETKTHEAIVSIDCHSRFVHAALLAMGAKAGTPVRFRPKYTPAHGSVVDIFVLWKDKDGKQQIAAAQEWMRDERKKKTLEYPWVFGGSGFFKDEADENRYYADGGEMVCVANFAVAMLDLPIESDKANAALLYVANTEKIPPMDTPIRMVLVPRKGVVTKADTKDVPKRLAKDAPIVKELVKLTLPW